MDILKWCYFSMCNSNIVADESHHERKDSNTMKHVNAFGAEKPMTTTTVRSLATAINNALSENNTSGMK